MSEDASIHVPVLLDEVVQWLDLQPGATIVDGTFGGGGHASVIVERIGPEGHLIALDRDPSVIQIGSGKFAEKPVQWIQGNFCDLPEALEDLEFAHVDGILLDLGLSSDQLADQQRGFSFSATGPLDLRFDPERGEPAWKLLERLREKTLADLIYENGEERLSRRIARKIVTQRKSTPIRSAADLAALVRSCYPPSRSRKSRIDPATRTFQALRIAVNEELKSLEIALRRLPDCLRPGGKLAIISFHSLEDRQVKRAFASDDRLSPLFRKPITASPTELERNPRARSAKLRVAEKVAI